MDVEHKRPGSMRRRAPLRRFPAPHPLVTVVGILLAIAVWIASQRAAPELRIYYIPVAVTLAGVFVYVSRRSGRREVLRREQELEKLRNRPVLGLDE